MKYIYEDYRKLHNEERGMLEMFSRRWSSSGMWRHVVRFDLEVGDRAFFGADREYLPAHDSIL
jgi:hypothetical protein